MQTLGLLVLFVGVVYARTTQQQHEEHIDLSGHDDAVAFIQEALENRGHTVHRHTTRVSSHGQHAPLERMMEHDAAEHEKKLAAASRDLETLEEKEARLHKARTRMNKAWDARPPLQKAAMFHAVLQQLEQVDRAVDLMMHVETDHERGFVDWVKKKIKGNPPADLISEIVSEKEAKAMGDIAPKAPAKRVAVVYTDNEAAQLAEQAAVIEQALAFVEASDKAKRQDKKNWLFAVGVKLSKFAMYFALGAILTALGVTCPIAVALIGLGVGVAFEVVSLMRARAEGQGPNGLGAFVFNVAKGGAMTALGLEVFSDGANAVVGLLDFLCGTGWDTHGAMIAIPFGMKPATGVDAVKEGLNTNDLAQIQDGLKKAVAAGTLKMGAHDHKTADAKATIEAMPKYKSAQQSAKTEAVAEFGKSLKAETVKYAVCVKTAAQGAAALLERDPHGINGAAEGAAALLERNPYGINGAAERLAQEAPLDLDPLLERDEGDDEEAEEDTDEGDEQEAEQDA